MLALTSNTTFVAGRNVCRSAQLSKVMAPLPPPLVVESSSSIVCKKYPTSHAAATETLTEGSHLEMAPCTHSCLTLVLTLTNCSNEKNTLLPQTHLLHDVSSFVSAVIQARTARNRHGTSGRGRRFAQTRQASNLDRRLCLRTATPEDSISATAFNTALTLNSHQKASGVVARGGHPRSSGVTAAANQAPVQ